MEERDRQAARGMRRLLEAGGCDPGALRAAVDRVAPLDRDAWIDVALGLGPPPDDGAALPRGCVPYLPCPVDALLRIVDAAEIGSSDLLVDVGSGVGRAAAVVSLLTGAPALGIEVQPALVAAARDLARRLRLDRVSFLEADAADLPREAGAASVFLLYCPFSGDRLEAWLRRLEATARARPIRICTVDLPLPPCPWLEPLAPPAGNVAIHRSRHSREA